jgi:hypothetical protein
MSPDVMFQIAVGLPLSDDAIADIVNTVRDSVFTQSALDYFQKLDISPPTPQTTVSDGVLSVGVWIGADEGRNGKWTEDGFTDAQRLQALRSSGFLSKGQTVGFLFSHAMMHIRGRAELTARPTSGVHPDSLKASLSNLDVVTTANGSYSVPILPDIDYTYTVHEALSLDRSGPAAVLAARVISRNLDVSQLGLVEDAFLFGLVEQGLGGIALIGGEWEVSQQHPKNTGVASALADAWPTGSLVSKPLMGKFTFDWKDLTIDATSVRTRGALEFGVRSPQVRIVGPTAVSFPQTQPGATETYTLVLTDLRPENAAVVWGGAAQGTGLVGSARFDFAGRFPITATVTDSDNMTATGQTTVAVTVTKKDGGRNGAPP